MTNTQPPAPGVAAEFQKRPVTITAIQWTGDNLDAVLAFCAGNATYELMFRDNSEIVIATLEDGADKVAKHVATKGDWIIRGIQGEFYPCKPDIFEATYTAPPLPAQVQEAESRDDVLLSVIQRLNGNPYSLTKSECISEVQALRDSARTPAPGMAGGVGADPDRWCNAAMSPEIEGRLSAWLTNGAALHPLTINLVVRFARALAAKLAAAELKYGYSDGWKSKDWMDECRAHLLEHIAKGDPRDVAAYCAFLWHHGESTAAPHPSPAPQAAGATEGRPNNAVLVPCDKLKSLQAVAAEYDEWHRYHCAGNGSFDDFLKSRPNIEAGRAGS